MFPYIPLKSKQLSKPYAYVGPPTFEEFTTFLETEFEKKYLSTETYDLRRDFGYYHIVILCNFIIKPGCKWNSLCLRCCNLNDATAEILSEAILKNPLIINVDLRYNDITDLGCKYFADICFKRPNCKIHLPDNEFTEYSEALFLTIRIFANRDIWGYCDEIVNRKFHSFLNYKFEKIFYTISDYKDDSGSQIIEIKSLKDAEIFLNQVIKKHSLNESLATSQEYGESDEE